MNQSTFIFGAVFAAFFINITAKGELATYLGFFGVGGNSADPSQAANAAGSSAGSSIGGAIGAAASAGNAIGNIVGGSAGSNSGVTWLTPETPIQDDIGDDGGLADSFF